MIKKGLVIVIIVLLLLSMLISCKREAEIDKVDNHGNIDGDNENGLSEDIRVIVNQETKQTRIVSNRDNVSASSIYQVQWTNDEEILFSHKVSNEIKESNIFYSFNTNNHSLEKRFEIEGRIGDGHIVNGGRTLIYSGDGYNELYKLDMDKTAVKITDKQNWYYVSPDKTKIIINGIPEGQEEEFRRYLYNIVNNNLVELPDIPNIDYAFSNIAASWSPDSIHIASQNGDKENNISIINTIENRIVDKIKIQEAIIPPSSIWSPDGKKLAFMVQLKENQEYTFYDGHGYVYMTDKIGIYNVEEGSLEFYNLGEKLTINNNIRWNDNSQGVIVQTIALDSAKTYLSIETPEGEILPISFDYIDITHNKDISTILEDNIRKYGESYEHNKYIVGLFFDTLLVYTEIIDNQYIINFLNIENSLQVRLGDKSEYLQKIYKSEKDIYIVTLNGIFLIDSNLDHKQVVDFDSYLTDEVIGVDGFLSPSFTKVAIKVECDPTSFQKDFIEIIELSK